MVAEQDISVYLNNALRATHFHAEIDSEAQLPETVRDMPDTVTGKFVSIEPGSVQEMAAAWKRVMILNATQVLYTFTFDAGTGKFTARKR